MKKITLLLAFMLAFVAKGYSQVSGYAFSESTEAYTAVAGTSSTATGDDGIQNAIPIGFTFNYDGVDCTHFCVSTNGWIKMGNAATTGTTGIPNYGNAFSVTAGNRPLIAPFWDDNNLGSGNIQYVVTGSAPNRILEVGWNSINIGGNGATSGSLFASFKLRLYETTNVIDFVYGSVMAQAGALSSSVGLNGSSSFLSVTPAASSTVSSATANNAIAATTNLVGKKYTFTPPSCISPSGISVSALTTTSATISWSAVVPTPATGYEYVVSTSNVTPAGSGTATTAVSVPLTGLLPATTYYVFLRSNCGSGFSGWSSSFSFSTVCNSTNVPYVQDFESATIPAVPNCTSVINNGTGNVWTVVNNPGSGFTSKTLRYAFNSSSAADTWFFTQGINLTAGTSYRIKYDYGNNSTFFPENLKVAYGLNPTVASMTNSLADHPGILNGALVNNSIDFIPSADGVYYFGFNAYSAADEDYLFVDNINITVTPACEAPSNLTVTNLTTSAADIGWDAIPGSVNYEYVLDQVATDPAGTGASTTAIVYNASGLTPNTTYYFHVRNNCGAQFGAWTTKSFKTLSLPPVNDDCTGGIALTAGGVFGDYPVIATNAGATDSAPPTPNCASYLGGDVWYTVEVPASGSITIETNNDTAGGSAITDTGLAVYAGADCSSLTLVRCDDDSSLDGAFSKISLTGRIGGELLFINAWEYGNNTTGTFKISAYDASLSAASFDMNGFSAYPNPVKDVLNLSYTKDISNVSVHNLLGQEVLNKSVNAMQAKVDLSKLSNGTYLVKVTVDGLVKTIKVVKE